jgi:hypothetical protein
MQKLFDVLNRIGMNQNIAADRADFRRDAVKYGDFVPPLKAPSD